MTNPKITVVISIYNAGVFLRACLESVIRQTMTDIEIICIDDCSTDECPTILKEYLRKNERIRVIWHERNEGIVESRKQGVLAARAHYLMFLDGDDELVPHACLSAYNAIVERKTDVVYFGTRIVNSEGSDEQSEEAKSLYEKLTYSDNECVDDNLLSLCKNGGWEKIFWMPWNKIYQTDLLKAAFQELNANGMSVAEDVYLFAVFGYFVKSYSLIEDPLYLYRWGGLSTRHTMQKYVSFLYFQKQLETKKPMML